MHPFSTHYEHHIFIYLGCDAYWSFEDSHTNIRISWQESATFHIFLTAWCERSSRKLVRGDAIPIELHSCNTQKREWKITFGRPKKKTIHVLNDVSVYVEMNAKFCTQYSWKCLLLRIAKNGETPWHSYLMRMKV